ncbi:MULTISPECIES: DUF1656 domain-containing protein [Ochrobactrum]|jgi:hypothetical protein|uniref:DUF1656 domain-containing protein n=1 Tax=Ochrobactrum quorumnocens TaxID=271865 RepID=A0A5N1JVF1_9HYPH|nr:MULTISPECIES: DUF1656 domain-containing protein [Brucella/Ochrobactrum group]KAA9367290.1 DUF1656 domain-containing protein [[Ochrobactrum] quorumnocens]MBD7992085.1 DUF1656 domain-containing protein [Ochrobactrum gallinarum]MDH7793353.1 hypothetical protein [Ochrobactrum sp. AN78]
MIADVNSGGVLLPGLLVLAIAALVVTIGVVRLLATIGFLRALAHRPLIELAAFIFIYALLVQAFTASGPFS